jgi:hypothetical protein
MRYKTLIDLWPAPEYRDTHETPEQERARLMESGDHIELIERTDYQRVIRYRLGNEIEVQGTFEDWEVTVQAPCSLANSIDALRRIAFYAISGVRIPNPLAHHLAEAVDAMASAYEEDVDAAIDDAAVSNRCLKILGAKLGILAGHRRAAASFKLVGHYYEHIFKRVLDENSAKLASAQKNDDHEKISADEIEDMDDWIIQDAMDVAKKSIKMLFHFSDQQVERYLEKYQLWKDWGANPPDNSE